MSLAVRIIEQELYEDNDNRLIGILWIIVVTLKFSSCLDAFDCFNVENCCNPQIFLLFRCVRLLQCGNHQATNWRTGSQYCWKVSSGWKHFLNLCRKVQILRNTGSSVPFLINKMPMFTIYTSIPLYPQL